MIAVEFFYQNNQHSYKKEAVITELCNCVSTFLELPERIEVCLYNLDKNTYGGIDVNVPNRMGIDFELPYDSLPRIVIHELLHIHQRKIGKLKINRDGSYFWCGVFFTKTPPEQMPYEEYQKLPWEVDVRVNEEKVLKKAIEISLAKKPQV